MRLPASIRALPTLFRVGFAASVAYRAEVLVWVLATTMPLIMLALFTAVAAEAPMGRFGTREFTAYFLSTFIVRQLTGSWIVWELNADIRYGTLGMRLLRPIHPLTGYTTDAIASMPLRSIVAIPLAIISLHFAGTGAYTHDPVLWVAWSFAMAGAWLLTLLTNFAIGVLAFFFESSLKVMEIWLAFYFILSGYMVPVELFPGWFQKLSEWLPFRYQLALPVEIMTGALGRHDAWRLLTTELCLVVALALLASLLWRRGVRRFEAFGG